MRVFIEIAYDGGAYHGWQKQPNAMTVQEELEHYFFKLFQKPIALVGAGRTDAGVHARQMVAHVDLESHTDTEDLMYKLNRMLPKTISVLKIYKVHPEAHARFDALSREYRYYISRKKDPFVFDFALWERRKLDVEAMNKACALLKTYRNFQCFSKVKTDVKTYNCKIEKAFWKETDNQLIFTIKANRFLRDMVRAIVGTMLAIGFKRKEVAELKNIIESRDRAQAGKSVAAKGLFLHKIEYPKSIIDGIKYGKNI